MTDSDDTTRQLAASIIGRLGELLDGGHLARMIDGPIDVAAETFNPTCDVTYSHELFLPTVGRFVQHLYTHTLPYRRLFPLDQACDDAVHLMERYYRGVRADGYYGAIADALADSWDGMHLVLHGMAEAFKTHRRAVYRQRVLARDVGAANWSTRCQMAEILIRQIRPWMPRTLQHCQAAQFADRIPELLDAVESVTSSLELQQLF